MNSSQKVDLLVDWCSYEAAKFAVERWHYSKRMPKSKLAVLGVWENGRFIGTVIFGVGATADMAKQFGVGKWDACELVRVALQDHITPATKIISFAIRRLKRQSPGLRLIISYADPEYKHLGIIYQAGNWIYTGRTLASSPTLSQTCGRLMVATARPGRRGGSTPTRPL